MKLLADGKVEFHDLSIPSINGDLNVRVNIGQSIVILGANGAGKTRLGVYIEDKFPIKYVKRITSHRSLSINDKLGAISLERALIGLDLGNPDVDPNNGRYYRYTNKPAVALVNDYDFVLQALFAQDNKLATEHLNLHHENPNITPPDTILRKLKKIWKHLMPHRELIASDLTIKAKISNNPELNHEPYYGSEMSEGERVMLYLIGSVLLAPSHSIILIDEPELHLHKAILSRFWDVLEAERKDCAFIYITHDLDFVAARTTANKYAVYSYTPEPRWDIEEIISDDDLPERLVNELVGSRQAVLFVEGKLNGVDATIYRSVYRDWLVEPVGGCQSVIHAVSTFAKKEKFHRLGKIYGCVDADARDANEITHLQTLNVHVLPVAEIENILTLRPIFLELAKALHFNEREALEKYGAFEAILYRKANDGLEEAAVRYASRQLDATLKRLAPKSKKIGELDGLFQDAIKSLDLQALAERYRSQLRAAIDRKDAGRVLAIYDDKGVLSEAARVLGMKGRDDLSELVSRLLSASDECQLLKEIKSALPQLE